MLVEIKGKKVNITEELQNTLKQYPSKNVKKPVIAKKLDSKGDRVHEVDDSGNKKYINAIHSTHDNVYFDAIGNHYFRVFRSKVIDGIEVLITNPKIKTEKDCNLYGKGLLSHRQPIAGSEFWDNGHEGSFQTTEAISKGDPLSKIVLSLTREEVLDINIKPQGDSILTKVAQMSKSERDALKAILSGEDEEEDLLS